MKVSGGTGFVCGVLVSVVLFGAADLRGADMFRLHMAPAFQFVGQVAYEIQAPIVLRLSLAGTEPAAQSAELTKFLKDLISRLNNAHTDPRIGDRDRAYRQWMNVQLGDDDRGVRFTRRVRVNGNEGQATFEGWLDAPDILDSNDEQKKAVTLSFRFVGLTSFAMQEADKDDLEKAAKDAANELKAIADEVAKGRNLTIK